MSKQLKTLIRQQKIILTEKSDEIASAYILKSSKSLVSSKKLAEIGNYEDATALTYYSMYYSCLALLFKCGIKSESHTGTLLLLKEIFKIDISSIEHARKERIDKQYYIDADATKEDVLAGIRAAEDFNAEMKARIEMMSEEKLIECVNAFENCGKKD